MKMTLVAVVSILPWIAAQQAISATVTLGTAVPSVLDGVQNLNFSTSNSTNTAVNVATSDYLAGDNLAVGQTFTTGSHAGGYSLSSISVRQVSWGTTFWDYTGGTVTLQVFRWDSLNLSFLGHNNITQLALETATVGGEPDANTFSSGTPGANARWLTIDLGTPVAMLPNTMYGFQLVSSGTGGNDGFFIQLDGTSTNSYAGGFATGTDRFEGGPDPVTVWDGNNGRPSDRAFVATMTAVPEPAASMLGGIAALLLLHRSRKQSP